MTALERADDRFTVASLRIIREQMAPDASDADLAYFARVCNRLDLSPFADQIILVGRADKRVGRVVHRHQITVAGRRALATRTGELEGIDGPVWCGPRERGELVWREVWDEDEPPYCARVLVWRRGWKVPANGTAKWDEFAQTYQDGKPTAMWSKMPSHMLGKTAESMALRRAFPDTITAEMVDGFTEIPDLDSEAAVAEIAPVDQPPGRLGGVRPGDWDPSIDDQTTAHKLVANRPVDQRLAFLNRWRIDDFSAPFPPEAVAEILSGPVGVPGDTAPAGPDNHPEAEE